jgi:hypothetical protein
VSPPDPDRDRAVAAHAFSLADWRGCQACSPTTSLPSPPPRPKPPSCGRTSITAPSVLPRLRPAVPTPVPLETLYPVGETLYPVGSAPRWRPAAHSGEGPAAGRRSRLERLHRSTRLRACPDPCNVFWLTVSPSRCSRSAGCYKPEEAGQRRSPKPQLETLAPIIAQDEYEHWPRDRIVYDQNHGPVCHLRGPPTPDPAVARPDPAALPLTTGTNGGPIRSPLPLRVRDQSPVTWRRTRRQARRSNRQTGLSRHPQRIEKRTRKVGPSSWMPNSTAPTTSSTDPTVNLQDDP